MIFRNVDPKFQGERYLQYLAAVNGLKKLTHDRFGKSVLALAVRWVLDQGQTIALWGARNPGQLDPIGEIEGWHIDAGLQGRNRCHPQALHCRPGIAGLYGAAHRPTHAAGTRDGLSQGPSVLRIWAE